MPRRTISTSICTIGTVPTAVVVTAYLFPSASTPGRMWAVSASGDGLFQCNCPDRTYRQRVCKHERAWAREHAPRGAVADVAVIPTEDINAALYG